MNTKTIFKILIAIILLAFLFYIGYTVGKNAAIRELQAISHLTIFMKIKKSHSIIIGLSIGLIAILLTQLYRPYIYVNQINDFHFADTIGNLFSVPAALFLISGIRKSTTKISYSIPILVLTYSVIELTSLLGETCDKFDIIATIISGFITYILLKCILNISEL